METTTYIAERGRDGEVRLHRVRGDCWSEVPVGRSLAVRNHSPTGFEMGYGGSGPAQLALAILLDCLGREEAERLYQDFRREWIDDPALRLPGARRPMADRDIRRWAEGKGR